MIEQENGLYTQILTEQNFNGVKRIMPEKMSDFFKARSDGCAPAKAERKRMNFIDVAVIATISGS